jgi:hypothetical protein
MLKHFRNVLIVVSLVLATVGCSRESGSSTERIKLPFEVIRADLDIEIPSGTEGRFTGDGEWPPRMIFDPPVHPLGHVRSLQIENRDVALRSTELTDGMLATRDFGEIEFILLGPGQIEARATRKQIGKIEKWISAGSG